MTFSTDRECYRLQSTGRTLRAFHGVIGLNHELEVHGGYDDYIDAGDFPGEDLTKPEKLEIADYMMELWRQYKQKVEQDG